eukprot:TRINITY_DN1959_c0_g1_i1.p2 TRINITY_DN1959_c0_g1~~TRINITY_DN1959_c0_g1_i1.p2  ORF type:complete len:872 (-),score=111.98 TRINITY_DN1959_c0_g1_i1:141-2756(-)
MLWQLLVQELPWDGLQPFEVVECVTNRYETPPEGPFKTKFPAQEAEFVSEIYRGCVAYEPGDRLTLSELIPQLEEFRRMIDDEAKAEAKMDLYTTALENPDFMVEMKHELTQIFNEVEGLVNLDSDAQVAQKMFAKQIVKVRRHLTKSLSREAFAVEARTLLTTCVGCLETKHEAEVGAAHGKHSLYERIRMLKKRVSFSDLSVAAAMDYIRLVGNMGAHAAEFPDHERPRWCDDNAYLGQCVACVAGELFNLEPRQELSPACLRHYKSLEANPPIHAQEIQEGCRALSSRQQTVPLVNQTQEAVGVDQAGQESPRQILDSATTELDVPGLNAALCEMQEHLLSTPRRERGELKARIQKIEEKIETRRRIAKTIGSPAFFRLRMGALGVLLNLTGIAPQNEVQAQALMMRYTIGCLWDWRTNCSRGRAEHQEELKRLERARHAEEETQRLMEDAARAAKEEETKRRARAVREEDERLQRCSKLEKKFRGQVESLQKDIDRMMSENKSHGVKETDEERLQAILGAHEKPKDSRAKIYEVHWRDVSRVVKEFALGARICSECKADADALVECDECDRLFCIPCAADFHSRGLSQQHALAEPTLPLSDFAEEADVTLAAQHETVIRMFNFFYDEEQQRAGILLAVGHESLDTCGQSIKKAHELVGLLIFAARALQHLQETGIYHNDVKPQNFLSVPSATDFPVQICDFGSAHKSVPKPAKSYTKQYAAPEVLRHEEAGFPAQVYSFGIMLWQLLVQELPWDGLQPFEVVECVTNRYETPPEGPFKTKFPAQEAEFVSEIYRGCVAYEPGDRLTLSELIPQLEEFRRMIDDEAKAEAKMDLYTTALENPDFMVEMKHELTPVSYTHLTLPTKRIV